MAVTLHRCSLSWIKVAHACSRVEKALQEAGVDYEVAVGPLRRDKRGDLVEHTGQKLYPAIELEDGTWYREESKDMKRTIRDGKLMERAQAATVATSG